MFRLFSKAPKGVCFWMGMGLESKRWFFRFLKGTSTKASEKHAFGVAGAVFYCFSSSLWCGDL